MSAVRVPALIILVGAACLVLLPANTAADQDAVRELAEHYTAAWLANDADAVMALFTVDAVLLPHHGDDPVVGVDAIRTHFFPPDYPPVTVTLFEIEPTSISLSGATAFAYGRFALDFNFDTDDGKLEYSNAGNFMMVVTRNGDDEWRIHRYIWNDPVVDLNIEDKTQEPLSWLAGCWEDAGDGRLYRERWMSAEGKVMLGLSHSVTDGRTTGYEYMRIEESDGKYVFFANPSGQSGATFPQSELTDSLIAFENLTHDFPQRIVYRLLADGSLQAYVEGTMSGESRRIEFPMVRVECH